MKSVRPFHWIYLCFFFLSLFAIRLQAIVGFWLYPLYPFNDLLFKWDGDVGLENSPYYFKVYIPFINIQ